MNSTETGSPTLQQYLHPQVPEDTRSRYATLADRAQSLSIGVGIDEVVILDTETGGLNTRTADLLEVAAVRLRGGEIIDEFQTFCFPESGKVDPSITEITGITLEVVKDGLTPSEAIEQLAQFVRDTPVVAHNARFDQAMIEHRDYSQIISSTWYDSLELARIALPGLTSYKLAVLSEIFGIVDTPTLRAMDDVRAVAAVWRIILTALLDFPGSLLNHLASWYEKSTWSYRPLFSELAALKTQSVSAASHRHSYSLFERRRALSQQAQNEQTMAIALGEEQEKHCADDVELVNTGQAAIVQRAFGERGLVSTLYENYEPRTEQGLMAAYITDLILDSKIGAIEAGTGVGKSMAHLLPSAIIAQNNAITIGVATKTNTLTDQLLMHELPALNRALKNQGAQQVKYSIIKGYDHYPCMKKLEQEVVDTTFSTDEHSLNTLAKVLTYSHVMHDGDLDSAGLITGGFDRARITVTPAECLKLRCPYFPHECMLHGARKRARMADVVITNHALLLRDIALDGALLPPIRHWIVDEAHSFEEEARKQWSLSLTKGEVNHGLAFLGDAKNGALGTLNQKLKGMPSTTLIHAALTKVHLAAARVAQEKEAFFEEVTALFEFVEVNKVYSSVDLWINDEIRQSSEWGILTRAAREFLFATEDLAHQLNDLIGLGRTFAESAPQHEAADIEAGFRLIGTASEYFAAMIEALSLTFDRPSDAYVYVAHTHATTRDVGFEVQPYDVGARFRDEWYQLMHSVVYTSATLATEQKFDHFLNAVGVCGSDANSARTRIIPSSYNYEENMKVIGVTDLAIPGSPEYFDTMKQFLFDAHVAAQGATLTLFTNRLEMERLFKELHESLADEGITLLMQGRGMSPKELRDAFVSQKTASLFALRSFWEGFDAAGETLSCVIIPKLPFRRPNDPLSKEREIRVKNAWRHFALPESIITTKQAVGRLIRHSQDRGVVIIADSRVTQKWYGKVILSSLPNPSHELLQSADVAQAIKRHLR